MSTSHATTLSLLGAWYDRVRVARPFLRWVGGKHVFVARLGSLFPAISGRYFEPFLGSGAVFFFLQRRQQIPLDATLGDMNLQLIQTYAAIRSGPDTVSDRLDELQHGYTSAEDKASYYYAIREKYNAELPHPDPADFIFLNRTCWNGFYRVNRRGEFNVPYGRPKSGSVVPSRQELADAGSALVRAKLKASGWENTIASARPGDFVFLDPPYFSDVERRDSKYRARQFSLAHHERLAARLKQLSDRGVDFVLTNSAENEMIEMYRDHGLHVSIVSMPRTLSTKVLERSPTAELLVTPSTRMQPSRTLGAQGEVLKRHPSSTASDRVRQLLAGQD